MSFENLFDADILQDLYTYHQLYYIARKQNRSSPETFYCVVSSTGRDKQKFCCPLPRLEGSSDGLGSTTITSDSSIRTLSQGEFLQ